MADEPDPEAPRPQPLPARDPGPEPESGAGPGPGLTALPRASEPAPEPAWREWRRKLLPAAIALILILFWVDDMPWVIDPRALARVEALPAELLRSEAPAVRAIQADYARGEYSAALLALASLRFERPNDLELMLLAGSAHLMVGETREAHEVLGAGVAALDAALEQGADIDRGLRVDGGLLIDTDSLVGESLDYELRWQFAQTCLELRDWATAEEQLEQLALGASPRYNDAVQQKDEL